MKKDKRQELIDKDRDISNYENLIGRLMHNLGENRMINYILDKTNNDITLYKDAIKFNKRHGSTIQPIYENEPEYLEKQLKLSLARKQKLTEFLKIK